MREPRWGSLQIMTIKKMPLCMLIADPSERFQLRFSGTSNLTLGWIFWRAGSVAERTATHWNEHTMHPLNTRFVTRWLAAAILSMMTLTTYGATNPQADDPEYRWDLRDLYPSPEAWTAEHDKIAAEADAPDSSRAARQEREAMLRRSRAFSGTQADRQAPHLRFAQRRRGRADRREPGARPARRCARHRIGEATHG